MAQPKIQCIYTFCLYLYTTTILVEIQTAQKEIRKKG